MVDRSTDDACWLWTGPVRKRYGAISAGGGHGRTLRSNRVAWELANGRSIPDGLLVRHRCDVPLCCNPSHLELGTAQDNTDDCSSRGRMVRGADHPRSRLTEEDVRAIHQLLAEGHEQQQIAARLGVHKSLISGIKRGTRWGHLTTTREKREI